jgi:hypothetical protein
LADVSEQDVEQLILENKLDRREYSMIVKPKHAEYLKVEFNFSNKKENNSINKELIKEL